MLTARLRSRVPSAKSIGPAELTDYRLAWRKAGADGSAKCDIVPSSASGVSVWGVLFEIPSAERAGLDEAEGLGSGYRLVSVSVKMCESRAIDAFTYRAIAIDTRLKPFVRYKNLVVSGALEHGLPTDYIELLNQVDVSDEPRERH